MKGIQRACRDAHPGSFPRSRSGSTNATVSPGLGTQVAPQALARMDTTEMLAEMTNRYADKRLKPLIHGATDFYSGEASHEGQRSPQSVCDHRKSTGIPCRRLDVHTPRSLIPQGRWRSDRDLGCAMPSADHYRAICRGCAARTGALRHHPGGGSPGGNLRTSRTPSRNLITAGTRPTPGMSR